MKYEEILKILAPCGLNCEKCVAYHDGPVRHTSIQLQELLGNFDQYAERYSKFIPVFQNYPSFKQMLKFFTESNCKGCRGGHNQYPTCGVATCDKINQGQVDFCFECEEFPCNRPQFHPDLERRWRERNERMKEVGVEAYYEESKDKPRYV